MDFGILKKSIKIFRLFFSLIYSPLSEEKVFQKIC